MKWENFADEMAEAEPVVIEATPYAWKQPEDIPLRDWLYGYQLIRKFVSGTISPGGVGKSSLIAAEALAMVSGKDLLGTTPKQQLRVWLWNLEDPTEETERKIQAAAMHSRLLRRVCGSNSPMSAPLLMLRIGSSAPALTRTTTRAASFTWTPTRVPAWTSLCRFAATAAPTPNSPW
ncbi:hypothetical protein ABIF64_006856 [Bradyrhizobium japonicum]